MSPTNTLLIVGGGTGGHVNAGIAVAQCWMQDHGAQGSVHFVGARGGIEERLVPKSGYTLDVLSLGSLNRVSLKQKIKTLLLLPVAFLRSMTILMVYRPQCVLGVGGYASGPVILIASWLKKFRILKTRIALLEQNSVAGFTNRILSRRVDLIFTAFPGVENQFPGKEVHLTGNPIRNQFQRLSRPASDLFTLFIFGGSQGAVGMNTLVLSALPSLESRLKERRQCLRMVHQTGEKDFQRVGEAYAHTSLNAQVEKFIYNIQDVYQEASLVTCRAGASTLSELAAVGRASILVPLPTASDQHQEKNARIFSDAQAAVLCPQNSTSGEELAEILYDLIVHPEKISHMEEKVVQFNRADAAQKIVRYLEIS